MKTSREDRIQLDSWNASRNYASDFELSHCSRLGEGEFECRGEGGGEKKCA